MKKIVFIVSLIVGVSFSQDICETVSAVSEQAARDQALVAIAKRIASQIGYSSEEVTTVIGIEGNREISTTESIKTSMEITDAVKCNSLASTEKGIFRRECCISKKDAARPYLDSLRYLAESFKNVSEKIIRDNCGNISQIYRSIKNIERVLIPLNQMDEMLQKEYESIYKKAGKVCGFKKRVGIDVRNKEWSDIILKQVASYNRFDIYDKRIYKDSRNESNIDIDFSERYDYTILASNYKKEWVRTDAGGYNLESMDVVIAQGKKTLKSYKAYCAQGDGKQGDHRDIFSSDYCVAEAFLKVAALESSVIEINGKDIVINHGSSADVKKYDEFNVLDAVYNGERIGKIRVTKVGSETAVAEKIRGDVFEGSLLEQTEPFGLSSWYLMISGANLVSQKYPKEQVVHISGLLGFEYIGRISQWGGGLFVGGGGLSADGGIGEFILGGDVKRLVWIANEQVALMPSVGLAWRCWVGSVNADVVSEISAADGRKNIFKNSFDIMPAMDLQFFLSESFSLFAGYMYRLAISGDWNFDYKVDGYGDKAVYIPDEYAPTKKDAKASIGVPGVLRAGVKWHP